IGALAYAVPCKRRHRPPDLRRGHRLLRQVAHLPLVDQPIGSVENADRRGRKAADSIEAVDEGRWNIGEDKMLPRRATRYGPCGKKLEIVEPETPQQKADHRPDPSQAICRLDADEQIPAAVVWNSVPV